MNRIAEKIQRIMEEKDFTQNRLARELGVSQPSVSQYLKGRMPSAAVLQRLSRLSGHPVSYFLDAGSAPAAVRENPPEYGAHAGFLEKWEKLSDRQQQVILDIMDEFLKTGKK